MKKHLVNIVLIYCWKPYNEPANICVTLLCSGAELGVHFS